MIKRHLTYIASWLFRNEPENKARFEIYQGIDHKHPSEEIHHNFSEKTREEISRVGEILKDLEEKRQAKLKRRKRRR